MPKLDAVRRHYARQDIVPRLLAAIRAERGADVALTPETLAPLDHYHRGGLGTTRHLMERLRPRPEERLLDIGAGLGGPARWVAATHGCHVTAVDLMPDYCAAARALTDLTGLQDRVRVLEGDAAELPLPDRVFDRAWSQSVMMNLPDKPAFCREAFRVLKPGGRLLLSLIAAGTGGAPDFPLPYAETPAASFLATPAETRQTLEGAGFEILAFDDVTPALREQQRAHLDRLESSGLPPLGWHVLIGPERALPMQANAARAFLDGRILELEVLARRPAT